MITIETTTINDHNSALSAGSRARTCPWASVVMPSHKMNRLSSYADRQVFICLIVSTLWQRARNVLKAACVIVLVFKTCTYCLWRTLFYANERLTPLAVIFAPLLSKRLYISNAIPQTQLVVSRYTRPSSSPGPFYFQGKRVYGTEGNY
jgi:hypothetical protein